MKTPWRTPRQGQDIVVYRGAEEVDRVDARKILRVVFVHRDGSDAPGDLLHALVETEEDCLLFPADTGFAGRVNFERQVFWAERGCVYWVPERQAPLPMRLRRGVWFLRSSQAEFKRVPRAELAGVIERWPMEGPQTWEQRKWRRIENSRPFANSAHDARLRA